MELVPLLCYFIVAGGSLAFLFGVLTVSIGSSGSRLRKGKITLIRFAVNTGRRYLTEAHGQCGWGYGLRVRVYHTLFEFGSTGLGEAPASGFFDPKLHHEVNCASLVGVRQGRRSIWDCC
jgi:hypothetical protein